MNIRVVLRALAPIAHGSFQRTGNAILFRRMSVVSAEGMPRIPAISGNALRGVLRRIVMRDLFAHVGLDRKTPGWDRLYGALANGGTLDGSEKVVHPDVARDLRAALPPLSAFGAALYSSMLAGHLRVGILWPVCRETAGAELVRGRGDWLAEDLIEEITHVRLADEQQDREASGVGPMPATHEVLKAGTVLECELSFAAHSTPAEIGCVLHGLHALDLIGAKSAAGLGRVEVVAGLDGDGLADAIGAYRSWREDRDAVRASLLDLAKRLAK